MVYVMLADGFEEIEAIAPVDILRRAGLSVKTVSLGGRNVKGCHGITFEADMLLADVRREDMTMIVLPGGMPGAKTLAENRTVAELVKYAAENGITVGAICAAPIVLGRLGLLSGRRAICYPGFENELTGASIQKGESVCEDGCFVTARGPGAAFEFAYKLVSVSCGWKKSEELEKAMCYNPRRHPLT